MKIAITVTADSPEADLDPRFGRAACYLVVDLDGAENDQGSELTWKVHPNPAVDASGGAGVQAARFMSELGVTTVISGRFGPSAFEVLNAAGIEACEFPDIDEITVEGLIEQYRSGSLTVVTGPGGPGFHGS